MSAPSVHRRIAAVIVAAGRGERAGPSPEGPKQYRLLGGQPILRRTTARFLDCDLIDRVVVVVHRDDGDRARQALHGLDGDRLTIVTGAANRQASVRNGLLSMSDDPPELVLIHDGVRPMIDAVTIERLCHETSNAEGLVVGVRVTDTVKRTDAYGRVSETIDRSNLFRAQTPQAFAYARIMEAHDDAADAGIETLTDDAAVAERVGMPIRMLETAGENRKITFPEDIAIVENTLRALPDIRVGNGYDVHRFEPGEAVTLCGVDIAHERKLSGHSDADVGLHALTDALLGTIGAGDIGTHFPPSDPQWKGASSDRFLAHAVSLVEAAGGRIMNADVTLIAEAPKIGPHRDAMVAAMSRLLKLDASRVSVKATTNERLGFIGREEGIAAIATACVAFSPAGEE